MAKRIFVKAANGQVHKDIVTTRTITPEETVRWMRDDGWDESGWHGGGTCTVRKTMRTKPRKGTTWRGKQAHPNILKLT